MLSCNTRVNHGDRRIALAFWLPAVPQVQLQTLSQGANVERDREGCLTSSSGLTCVFTTHIDMCIPPSTCIYGKGSDGNYSRREVRVSVLWEQAVSPYSQSYALRSPPGWLHTCAVAPTLVQLIAIITAAAERSRQVFTVPKHAQVPNSTLVHICGDLSSVYHA